MRVELIGHFKPCMTEIHLHIDARMADYIRTHPHTHRLSEAPISRTCTICLDHVQSVQIHAVRAIFMIAISVRSGYVWPNVGIIPTFGHAVKSTQISHLRPVCTAVGLRVEQAKHLSDAGSRLQAVVQATIRRIRVQQAQPGQG